jgi:hypothetical protein
MARSQGLVAGTVYKHVSSRRETNRISTAGSYAHPGIGGAREGRGARAMKSGRGVWPTILNRWGRGTNNPFHSPPVSQSPYSQAHLEARGGEVQQMPFMGSGSGAPASRKGQRINSVERG